MWRPHPTTEILRTGPHRSHAPRATHSLHWPHVRMTLWSCGVHVSQHGMRAWASAWRLVGHPDGGTSWASSKARRHKGLEKAGWHWSSRHALTGGHPSHHRTGGCCCTVIMEGFCFAGVVTCLPPLRCGTIQVPEYTPPGMEESGGFSECYVFLPSYL